MIPVATGEECGGQDTTMAYNHWLTPPWWEHVPLLCWLNE